MFFDSFFRSKKPWLNLTKRNKIVGLVYKHRFASIDQKMKDHIKRNQMSLARRKLRYGITDSLFRRCQKLCTQLPDSVFLGRKLQCQKSVHAVSQGAKELYVLLGMRLYEIAIPAGKIIQFKVGLALLGICNLVHGPWVCVDVEAVNSIQPFDKAPDIGVA